MTSTSAGKIQKIISMYDNLVKNIEKEAKSREDDRSYGGVLRSSKGTLIENIAESLIFIAWQEVGGKVEEITINSSKINIPIQDSYIANIINPKVRKHIQDQVGSYTYKLSVDKHVYVKDEFVLAMECKSYAENAMLKRICVDFDLLRKMHPSISCYLLQLESQLGGDYSELPKIEYGSRSTHTILSYFPADLRIITLLQGERDIYKPIHINYKPLKKEQLQKAIDILKEDLKNFV